jgi:thymidylate synthase ThyX
VVAALLYRFAKQPYSQIWDQVKTMTSRELESIINSALENLGPHDVPVRELELVDYTFDLLMDYGAYREFKRHRMQSYIAQPPTMEQGYLVPPLVTDAGLEADFHQAMDRVESAFHTMLGELPRVAQYLVTHAHKRRVLSKMNLRECYHLFKLRTSPTTHFSLVWVVQRAMELAKERHPVLFKHLRLRRD